MALKRLAIAAALLTAWTTAAAAKPVTLASETNLRATPGTSSNVVALIPKGETVEVGDCDAGWCKVTWNGNEGYAIGRNLGQAAPRTAQRRPARRYASDGYVPGPPPGEYYEDGPVVYGPPVYGYYPYPGSYWYGGWGWRAGWHHHRRW